MKKQFSILAFLLLLSISLIAQNDKSIYKDSTSRRGITLEINPTLLIETLAEEGEYGLYGQIPVGENGIRILVGGGFNITNSGGEGLTHGYSFRPGVSFPLNKKIYISIQLMYRKWLGILDSVANYSGVFNNSLLNPFVGFFGSPQTSTGPYGNGGRLPYDVDNVTMTSYGIDVVFGRQVPLFKSEHFVFEWYIGAGIRLHSYSIEKIGRYDDYLNVSGQVQYEPLPTPIYSNQVSVYPDLKLGCMIGYKF
ncbi:MAG TPA: hypothetical protein VN922_05690 [Bacteroidia bacterium]|nr:hypothetical protein [Bacteroidia bacterium]